jgi:hypothetical protein
MHSLGDRPYHFDRVEWIKDARTIPSGCDEGEHDGHDRDRDHHRAQRELNSGPLHHGVSCDLD